MLERVSCGAALVIISVVVVVAPRGSRGKASEGRMIREYLSNVMNICT
jgi:hypothetical protein